jgi:hypothetical protein
MNDEIRPTYRVRRVKNGGRENTIASGIESLAEAAEVALRLTEFQETEFGGFTEFYAEPE